MSFKAFIEAAKSIISVGTTTNAAARREIREVVGKLGDELDRALSLADSWLVGAKFCGDDVALARYLADMDGKLMGSFMEHQVCAELYHLADKFDQLFDPTRFAVSLAHHMEIPRLIGELKKGERVVLDDLTDIVDQLRDSSSRLHAGVMTRGQVLEGVERHREQVGRYRKSIRQERRDLLEKL